MQFKGLSALLLLPMTTIVNADWDLWTTTCCVAGGGDDPCFDNSSVGTYGQWACNGYIISDDFDFHLQFTTVNPCNPSETIIYKPNGNDFNIYVLGQEAASQQIGYCFPGDLTSASCQYGVTACSANRYISCQSTHCN